MRWAGHKNAWGRREVYSGFVCENLKESGRFEGLGICERLKLKCVLKEQGGVALTGSIWLRFRVVGGLL